MAYRVTVVIACDAPSCGMSVSYGRDNSGGMTKTFAGALAERDGWWIAGKAGSHDPKRALCRLHRPDTLLNSEGVVSA